MSIERVKQLIKQKEGLRLEFKETKSALPANLFETVCAMLNREGGDILLGINDTNKILGVDKKKVNQLLKDISNLSNNPEKLNPTYILQPKAYEIGKHTIIHIQIPQSSQVHQSGKFYYDRSSDGDFKVTQAAAIAALHNQKKSHYTEGRIYPAIKFTHFKKELFAKVRSLIKSNKADHPWLSLSDKKLLETAGLYRIDYKTGEKGYTLAAALLFGKDELIQQIVPHYKIDALVRIKDTSRYDDREYIQTNLIEAYEQLMAFVAKQLPDKFYTEGDQRRSLRTIIFREIVANLIVHREYLNAHPAHFIIYNNRVETENANIPHGKGPINPKTFTPFPKNPLIAKFFIQLGRVDELGSGVLNVNKYIKQYAGKDSPKFIEGDVFKMQIPIPKVDQVSDGVSDGVTKELMDKVEGVIEGVTEGVTEEVKDKLKTMLLLIHKEGGIRTTEMEKKIEIPVKSLERYVKLLKDANIIEYKGASRTGGYYLTRKTTHKLKP